jgi:uncharacterized protein (DUF1684 family)
MAPIGEEPDWEPQLQQYRQKKDDQFRNDPETPLRAEDVASFDGLEYWPPGAGWRFRGPVHPHPEPTRFTVATTAGPSRRLERYGWLSFVHDGEVAVLQVYRNVEGPGAGSLFLPFSYATAGTETYPAGRYVDLVPDLSGEFVLDFNRAYNPFCAYGDPHRFACPVAPAENRLPFRLEAGERGYHRPEPPEPPEPNDDA